MSHTDAERGEHPASTKIDPTSDQRKNSQVARILKAVMQLGMVGGILLAGLVGAVFINSIEASKPAAEGGHGGHAEEGGGDAHEGHGGHGGHDDSKEGRNVAFSAISFKNANLGLAVAGPMTLQPQLSLNGIITPNEERVVQVTPRFPGVVRSINKRLGSMVRRGDILVSIEGDEDLKRYVVNSAIDGTVISRRVGLGEHVDRNHKMMVIADLRTVWADFRVFARDFKKLQLHQKIEISLSSGGPAVKAKIAYISPIGMADTQSMLARAIVDNPDGTLRPGLFVTGEVQVGAQQAFVAVHNSAIQYLEGKPVVFVEQKAAAEKEPHKDHADHKEAEPAAPQTKEKPKDKEGHDHAHEGEGKEAHTEPMRKKQFIAMDVELGPTDGHFTEIYFGVLPGQTYVADNSFMLKAELSKGMAAHSH